MSKDKLNFSKIKAEAIKLAQDESAKNFIKGAARTVQTETANSQQDSKAPKDREALPIKKKQRKLIVEGSLKNRSEICRKSMQLYVKKELAEWIDSYTSAGKGGQQIILNYLIKRGIQAVEAQFEASGIVFADES